MATLNSTISLSIIIVTMDRASILNRTLKSLTLQNTHPKEIIIIDASQNFKEIKTNDFKTLRSEIKHLKAITKGAAPQRNYGFTLSSCNTVGFFDDDILLEKNCIKKLWEGLQSNSNFGGINAIITNQSYHPLGVISKLFYKLMGGNTKMSLAGKCIGPAINFLPELENEKDLVEVEWLNTTCTLYKKKALPNPVFDEHFTGYSLMEDLALSLRVSKNWKLFTANNAKIYHDSQPGEGKGNKYVNAEMELVNRFYIMKYILDKKGFKDYFQLFTQQLFGAITSKNIISLSYLRGKYSAIKKIRSI